MRTTLRIISLACVAATASTVFGQDCFFSADFEDGTIPADWTNSSVTIIATGETTDAWTVGTAAEANYGGFFPVPDIPIGNHFAMVNDDAPPCDCVIDQVQLTTPLIDLTARSNVAMRCRAFHEMALGGGPAKVEATTTGSDWVMVDSLPAVQGSWQDMFIDLSAYDGSPTLQLRFTWSDGGEWASGFAVDDICLYERVAYDLAVVGAFVNDPSHSAFDQSSRSLSYTRLPLTQAADLAGAVLVENRGTTTLSDVTVTVAVTLGADLLGTVGGNTIASLEPGERAYVNVAGLPTPGNSGQLTLDFQASYSGPLDDDPTNDTGSASVWITGMGWDNGYGAMALDDGTRQGGLGSEQGFIAANRMEVIAPATAFGVSAVLGTDSQLDEVVRAIIMDGNFAFIDTSERHSITQEDIDLAWGSGPIYLPFANAPSLTAGDYFVGLQRLSGTGRVSVSTSGNCAVGSVAFMEGSSFDITWNTAVPMVRVHLEALGVGLGDPPAQAGNGLLVFPQPVSTTGTLLIEEEVHGNVRLRVFDATGRVALETFGNTQQGHRIPLHIESLPSGTYVVEAAFDNRALRTRLVIAR